MKIRESSTLKFITKNFSAKHHNNFSEALTFSSGRFQSISHAKRGVRCPKGIETRLNFRCKPAKCALCFCALNKPQSPPPASKNNLILSEQSERFNFSPQAIHPASIANCALCIVLCALIKSEWLQNQHLMRNYLIVFNCRLRKKCKTVPKLPFLTRKPPFPGPFFQ